MRNSPVFHVPLVHKACPSPYCRASLGSGKTTLLNRGLNDREGNYIVVTVNDISRHPVLRDNGAKTSAPNRSAPADRICLLSLRKPDLRFSQHSDDQSVRPCNSSVLLSKPKIAETLTLKGPTFRGEARPSNVSDLEFGAV
ncbi:GTP-binding protein [Manganibacter manganicus]|uniref:GTP-binding protein n=1 Tax=Manganibacter manganicus TaxID=1873176 RepID=UPI003CC9543C